MLASLIGATCASLLGAPASGSAFLLPAFPPRLPRRRRRRRRQVAGNFHVALGESVVRDGRFIHQFQPADAPKFNASHVVHSLSFGDPYPGMRANPMDNKVNLASVAHGTGLYQYFIKLVPTLYEQPRSETQPSNLWTNQYSFTERFRPLAEHMGGPHLAAAAADHHAHGTAKHQPIATTVLPGVFWVYDLSAFMLQVSLTPLSRALLLDVHGSPENGGEGYLSVT
jgi:hypothetical protein